MFGRATISDIFAKEILNNLLFQNEERRNVSIADSLFNICELCFANFLIPMCKM